MLYIKSFDEWKEYYGIVEEIFKDPLSKGKSESEIHNFWKTSGLLEGLSEDRSILLSLACEKIACELLASAGSLENEELEEKIHILIFPIIRRVVGKIKGKLSLQDIMEIYEMIVKAISEYFYNMAFIDISGVDVEAEMSLIISDEVLENYENR